ncbi:MAG TPA: hypothetical protein VNQ76_17605 [Planctomicrobium sp.]|nr:hypothetical protein [Planctomicrobium sp.]
MTTWRRLYEVFCQQLAAQNPERFRSLPDDPEMARRDGRRFIDRSAENHNVPSEVVPGMFIEVNLSANSIRHSMRRMLKTFGLSESEMKIYFREDRDADRETRNPG